MQFRHFIRLVNNFGITQEIVQPPGDVLKSVPVKLRGKDIHLLGLGGQRLQHGAQVGHGVVAFQPGDGFLQRRLQSSTMLPQTKQQAGQSRPLGGVILLPGIFGQRIDLHVRVSGCAQRLRDPANIL